MHILVLNPSMTLEFNIPATSRDGVFIPCGAKRTHVFQIIVTLFIFNIKELC